MPTICVFCFFLCKVLELPFCCPIIAEAWILQNSATAAFQAVFTRGDSNAIGGVLVFRAVCADISLQLAVLGDTHPKKHNVTVRN